MGYRYSTHSDGDLVVEVGSWDWRTHFIRVWDDNAFCIRLSADEARRLIPLLEKAAADCDTADRQVAGEKRYA